jgi:plastocyanin
MTSCRNRWWVIPSLFLCLSAVHAYSQQQSSQGFRPVRQIIVPGEDRFVPFSITVRVGQQVQWVNTDTDDHTVVSNDAFNTAGHRGTNVLLKGNGGTFTLVFRHPGVFPFYCRFHAVLDDKNQPKAPGPDGGIQDPDGNFGTPMNGVITVLGHED